MDQKNRISTTKKAKIMDYYFSFQLWAGALISIIAAVLIALKNKNEK